MAFELDGRTYEVDEEGYLAVLSEWNVDVLVAFKIPANGSGVCQRRIFKWQMLPVSVVTPDSHH